MDSIELHIPHCALCFCSTHEYSAKVFCYHWLCLQSPLSKMSLILWMFWTVPLLLPILPIPPGNLFPHPSGSCPCGPSGSQGLAASSWHGLGYRDSWDPWPPGLQQPTHHHQQPIKTRSFPLQTPRKSLQVPSHHSNCCFILGHKTELLSNPWLSITTSSSKWVVWIYHWFDC